MGLKQIKKKDNLRFHPGQREFIIYCFISALVTCEMEIVDCSLTYIGKCDRSGCEPRVSSYITTLTADVKQRLLNCLCPGRNTRMTSSEWTLRTYLKGYISIFRNATSVCDTFGGGFILSPSLRTIRIMFYLMLKTLTKVSRSTIM